jgi:hypothetical protein
VIVHHHHPSTLASAVNVFVVPYQNKGIDNSSLPDGQSTDAVSANAAGDPSNKGQATTYVHTPLLTRRRQTQRLLTSHA